VVYVAARVDAARVGAGRVPVQACAGFERGEGKGAREQGERGAWPGFERAAVAPAPSPAPPLPHHPTHPPPRPCRRPMTPAAPPAPPPRAAADNGIGAAKMTELARALETNKTKREAEEKV
jgi:hypothetical protein